MTPNDQSPLTIAPGPAPRTPRTVFVSGNFNILHPGHLRLLRFARELGDRLIVAVHSDRLGGAAVHVPEQLRLEGLRCNSWVDEAFLIDEPVPNVVARRRPDLVVKGKEHEGAYNPELAVLEQAVLSQDADAIKAVFSAHVQGYQAADAGPV